MLSVLKLVIVCCLFSFLCLQSLMELAQAFCVSQILKVHDCFTRAMSGFDSCINAVNKEIKVWPYLVSLQSVRFPWIKIEYKHTLLLFWGLQDGYFHLCVSWLSRLPYLASISCKAGLWPTNILDVFSLILCLQNGLDICIVTQAIGWIWRLEDRGIYDLIKYVLPGAVDTCKHGIGQGQESWGM